MQIHVISLDRTPDRLAEFNRANAHLRDVVRFPAVDGGQLDVPSLVRGGFMEPGIAQIYSRGAMGLALSHLSLWEKAIASQQMLTVCEDDAIFNLGFEVRASELINTLQSDWDVLFWGWNFDSVLQLDLLPGVSPCAMVFDQTRLRARVELFQRLPIHPQAIRLLGAFGSIAYTVSPKGALALKTKCFPLREMILPVPLLPRPMANVGIDVVLSSVYPHIRAFASVPPLVVTKNEGAKSTVNARKE